MKNRAIATLLVATTLIAGFSMAGLGYPSISNDFVFLIDKSNMLQSQLDWMLDAHSEVIRNQIAPLADGPGQVRVAIVTFRQHPQTVIGLTDVYTDFDAVMQALSTRYIDRNTDSGTNTSAAIDAARAILDGGTGFRQAIVLSSRFFPNTWNNNTRPIACDRGAEGICARVAMREACDDAVNDGYELWALEIDHFAERDLPGLMDFSLMMSECAGSPERYIEVGSQAEFSNFIEEMVDQGLNACVNVGFERDLDRNINDRVDTNEFFEAVDFWVNQCMPDSVFFNILDLWISQGRISTLRSSSAELDIQLETALTARALNVNARNASGVHISIFDTSGAEIYTERAAGPQLHWNLRTSTGHAIANGVYFAQITTFNATGDVIGTRIEKLAVLR